MASRKVLLLIADIGGYTGFIRAHKTSLAHADLIIHELLDAIVKAADGPFELSKLEGDAAFLFADLDAVGDQLAPTLAKMHRAFHATQQMIDKNQMCGCAACEGAGGLKLKAVAHQGEAIVRKIRQNQELTGEPVIVVHRMLKNDVPIKEYVLFSDELAQGTQRPLQCQLVCGRLNLEGIGEVPTAYLDLALLAGTVPPPIRHPWPMRFLAFAYHGLLALPYRLGLKRALKDFRNVPI